MTSRIVATGSRYFRVIFFGLELLGLITLVALVIAWARPDLVLKSARQLNLNFPWVERWAAKAQGLPEQSAGPADSNSELIRSDPRFKGVTLDQLTKSQAAVATWLGTKYRVAPEAIAILLLEAEKLSKESRLDKHLILAVMAVESNFHPFIESRVGAQGLMQVMPKIHAQRYAAYGGKNAAFDPIVNLQVGVSILRDAIKLNDGSEDAGLIFYFGGDGDSAQEYLAKVRAEQARLQRVAAGELVPNK